MPSTRLHGMTKQTKRGSENATPYFFCIILEKSIDKMPALGQKNYITHRRSCQAKKQKNLEKTF